MYKNITYIEFIGLPGVGKSTVLGRLKMDWLQNDENIVYEDDLQVRKLFSSRLKFYYYLILFSSKNFNLISFLVSLIFERKANFFFHLKKSKHLIVKLTCIDFLSKNKNGNFKLILDQGIYQILWGFFYLDNLYDFNSLHKMCLKFHKFLPQKYIYVTCNEKNNLDRIYSRNKICKFKMYSESELKKIFGIGNQAFISSINHKIIFPVLVIDTTEEYSRTDKRIYDFIRDTSSVST